jgi:hypothetical protein
MASDPGAVMRHAGNYAAHDREIDGNPEREPLLSQTQIRHHGVPNRRVRIYASYRKMIGRHVTNSTRMT